MASPLPSSDPKTAVMGYPAPHDFPHRPHPSQLHAPSLNRQPLCSGCRMDLDWKAELWCLGVTQAAMVTFFIVLCISIYFFCVLKGPGNPAIKVAALTVSNLTVSKTTWPTWKASLSVEKSEDFGNLFFHEVECFIYRRWDEAKPLGLASVEPFVLRSTDTTEIKATIKIERPTETAIEDMDREWRSVGNVAVGLGLRMQATYVLGSWWKRGYGRIEAYCDNLRIAFPNSKGEGSLVTRDTGRSCTYNRVDPGPTF